MCGIAGWFSISKISLNKLSALDRMVNSLNHRGPDGKGKSIIDHAALGHTRLSIIDLEGGAQPIHSLDGQACIVFNGEIYNYKQLRHDLIKKGYQFKTHTDTEVILNLYLSDGINGFSRLRGMYAFTIWDNNKQQAILARDPLGIKPLFIEKRNDGGLIFGSEAKAILAYHQERPRLDEASLHLLLNFRYLPGNRSMFRGITQLEPGTAMIWKTGGSTKIFSIPLPDNSNLSVMDALQESIRIHFTSDVEVGTYLSGGLDSATIAAIGKNISPKPLHSFTLDAGDDPDEAHNAANTARLLNIVNIQGRIENRLDNTLPELLWHLEVPKINALQVSQLAQLASKYVKVTLSGLGGDELFLGYNAHKIIYRLFKLSKSFPDALTSFIGRSGARIVTAISGSCWTETERSLRMLAETNDWPRAYGLLRNLWDNPQMRTQVYGPRLLDTELPDAFDELTRLWPKSTNPVDAMAQFEWKNKMVNDLLWQEDRVSMANGIEVRVPFVDTVFSQSVQVLGQETLMPSGKIKLYMRNQLKNILPEEIMNRPKSGFQVSAPHFYHQHLANMAKTVLSEKEVHKYGLFNPAFVKHLASRPINKRHRWHYFILYFMILSHLWIKIFEEGSWTLQK